MIKAEKAREAVYAIIINKPWQSVFTPKEIIETVYGNYDASDNTIHTYLSGLHREGYIDKVRRGVYQRADSFTAENRNDIVSPAIMNKNLLKAIPKKPTKERDDGLSYHDIGKGISAYIQKIESDLEGFSECLKEVTALRERNNAMTEELISLRDKSPLTTRKIGQYILSN